MENHRIMATQPADLEEQNELIELLRDFTETVFRGNLQRRPSQELGGKAL